MTLSITRAHALTPRLVEIEAKGPRGGDYHFAAYYERDGIGIRLIVETNPTATVCHATTAWVPSEVLKAALTARSQAAL